MSRRFPLVTTMATQDDRKPLDKADLDPRTSEPILEQGPTVPAFPQAYHDMLLGPLHVLITKPCP
eukprot:3503001-Pyramimonas_sp.AAC.1